MGHQHEFYGMIVAPSGSAPLVRDGWIEACKSDPRLVTGGPISRRSPFNPDDLITINLPAETVAAVVDGRTIGALSWAADNSPLINVYGEDPALIAIARELASRLNAIFVEAADCY